MFERNHILTDIDHTISDAFNRDQLIGGDGGWDHYHSQAIHDNPIPDIAYMINALHNFGYSIIGLTGRPEKWRSLTMEWLSKHEIRMDELLMRPNNEFRPAPQVKIDLAVKRFPNIKDDVAFILDDRDDVCAAFSALGITAFQCFGRSDLNV